MFRETAPRCAWALAGALLLAGTAGAQQQGWGNSTGNPSNSTKGASLAPGSGGSTQSGFSQGGFGQGGFGQGWNRLSPELRRQVLLEAVVLAEAVAEVLDQAGVDFDPLFLFLAIYAERYDAAIQQFGAGGGSSGFGAGGLTPGGFGGTSP